MWFAATCSSSLGRCSLGILRTRSWVLSQGKTQCRHFYFSNGDRSSKKPVLGAVTFRRCLDAASLPPCRVRIGEPGCLGDCAQLAAGTGADLAAGAPSGEAPGVAGTGWESGFRPTSPAALLMPPLLPELMGGFSACEPGRAPRTPLLLGCVQLLPLRSSLARSAPSNTAVAAPTGLPELLRAASALLSFVPASAGCSMVGVEASLLPVAGLNETHSPAGLLAKLACWLPAMWPCTSVLRLLLREVLPDPAGSTAAATASAVLPCDRCCPWTLS